MKMIMLNGLFSLALVTVDKINSTEISRNSGQSEKKGIPPKVLAFFPKAFHQDEPFH